MTERLYACRLPPLSTSGLLAGESPEWSDKLLEHIVRQIHPRHELGPKFQRRLGNDFRLETDVLEIVVEVFPPPAMLGVAALADTRSALFPRADAPEVFALWVAKKHIGAATVTGLQGLAEQAALEAGQVVEVHAVAHLDEEIDVLRNGLGRGK